MRNQPEWVPTPLSPSLIHDATAEHIREVVAEGSLVVFTKRVGWRVIPAGWGLTDQQR